MSRFDLSRRDFYKLTFAALGGAIAGCSSQEPAPAVAEESVATPPPEQESALLQEPHVCCGLNTCKGQGAGGDNDCAGVGSCATAEHHSCKGQNACTGQAGCGEYPGENACKGQGECAVPLSAETWKKARANFESAMGKAGRAFSPAPENCGQGG